MFELAWFAYSDIGWWWWWWWCWWRWRWRWRWWPWRWWWWWWCWCWRWWWGWWWWWWWCNDDDDDDDDDDHDGDDDGAMMSRRSCCKTGRRGRTEEKGRDYAKTMDVYTTRMWAVLGAFRLSCRCMPMLITGHHSRILWREANTLSY